MNSQLDYEINNELGECYLFMGELDKARDYYNKAAGSNGSHPDPYLGLATIEVQEGNLENARKLYEKAARIVENDKSYAGMGLIEMENGSKEESFKHFLKALELNPENMIALFGLVQVGHIIGKIEETLPYLENYLRLDPDNHDVRYSLAGSLYQLNRLEETRENLERILESDPGHKAARELMDQIG
ncbi:MAG: tetratricopeptide repeat protein [Desulfonatronovibrionaceae bacterium]